MRNLLFLLLLCLFSLSCSNSEEQVKILATDHLKLTLDNPKDLEILGVSKVDSAFGVNYFTQKELQQLFEITKKVTQQVMRQTHDFTRFDNSNPALISLIERQMKASTELRSLLMKSQKKGDFSGYKMKIDYRCKDANGLTYKAERWVFTDPEGKQVLRTFEVPLL